jgi:hypothetical protein
VPPEPTAQVATQETASTDAPVKGNVTSYFLPEAPSEGEPGADASAIPGAPTTEAPAEGAPPPATPPEAPLTPLERAQKAAASAKRAAARNRDLQVRSAETERRVAETTRQLEQERAARTQAELTAQRLRDPRQRLDAMRELGVTAEEVARQAIAEGAPDAQVKQALAEVARLREEIAQRDRNAQTEQVTRNARQAQSAFVRLAQSEEAYPLLSQQPPNVILSAVKDVIANIPEAKRRDVTNEQLAEYLEWQYASHAKARSAAKDPTKALPVAAPSESKNGSPKPRTLTNGQGAAKYSQPKNWDQLSESQKRAESVRLLETLTPK